MTNWHSERVTRLVRLFASLPLLLLLTLPLSADERKEDDNHTDEDHQHAKVVGGYFEEWSIYFAGYNIANLQSNGVGDKLTHLSYAFGNATAKGCEIADAWADYQSPFLPSVSGAPYAGPLFGNFAALQQLKQLHPNLKVLISLAGAAGFSAAAGTAASRQAMVANCIDLFIQGNLAPGISAAGIFDGFDIDWEFPTAADTQNTTLLMHEFRKQLDALGETNGKRYLLTMFGPAGQQNFSNIQLAEVAEQLDYFNVQATIFMERGRRQPITRRRCSTTRRTRSATKTSTSITPSAPTSARVCLRINS